ncbi:unnamed protein product [Lampetra fluviatilis]
MFSNISSGVFSYSSSCSSVFSSSSVFSCSSSGIFISSGVFSYSSSCSSSSGIFNSSMFSCSSSGVFSSNSSGVFSSSVFSCTSNSSAAAQLSRGPHQRGPHQRGHPTAVPNTDSTLTADPSLRHCHDHACSGLDAPHEKVEAKLAGPLPASQGRPQIQSKRLLLLLLLRRNGERHSQAARSRAGAAGSDPRRARGVQVASGPATLGLCTRSHGRGQGSGLVPLATSIGNCRLCHAPLEFQRARSSIFTTTTT